MNSYSFAQPFDAITVKFFDQLGKKLVLHPRLRSRPEIVALGFWLRGANVLTIKGMLQSLPNSVSTARGVVFHIAPSNVDTIFVYSWALSLLCGNANIVKLSKRSTGVVDDILEIINEVMDSSPDFAEVKKRSSFVKLEHDSPEMKRFSDECDLRVIWGGDNTIQTIRKSFPIRPGGLEIGFADRFSYSVIKSNFFLTLSQEAADSAVDAFVKDSYVFDQKACSSPRVVFFVGTEQENTNARLLFSERVRLNLQSREITDSTATFKLKSAFEWAADGLGTVSYHGADLTTLTEVASSNTESIRRLDYGGGSFVFNNLSQLSELKTFIRKKDQTISQLGFSAEELKSFVAIIGPAGVERIVPFGEALSFNVIWDGYNLVDVFTRRVFCKT